MYIKKGTVNKIAVYEGYRFQVTKSKSEDVIVNSIPEDYYWKEGNDVFTLVKASQPDVAWSETGEPVATWYSGYDDCSYHVTLVNVETSETCSFDLNGNETSFDFSPYLTAGGTYRVDVDVICDFDVVASIHTEDVRFNRIDFDIHFLDELGQEMPHQDGVSVECNIDGFQVSMSESSVFYHQSGHASVNINTGNRFKVFAQGYHFAGEPMSSITTLSTRELDIVDNDLYFI